MKSRSRKTHDSRKRGSPCLPLLKLRVISFYRWRSFTCCQYAGDKFFCFQRSQGVNPLTYSNWRMCKKTKKQQNINTNSIVKWADNKHKQQNIENRSSGRLDGTKVRGGSRNFWLRGSKLWFKKDCWTLLRQITSPPHPLPTVAVARYNALHLAAYRLLGLYS